LKKEEKKNKCKLSYPFTKIPTTKSRYDQKVPKQARKYEEKKRKEIIQKTKDFSQGK
jgi:hypothetical protein